MFLIKGKPYLKEKISKNFIVPINKLSFNKSALNYIRDVKNRHRVVYLISGSHQILVDQIDQHLKIFSPIERCFGIATALWKASGLLHGSSQLSFQKTYTYLPKVFQRSMRGLQPIVESIFQKPQTRGFGSIICICRYVHNVCFSDMH